MSIETAGHFGAGDVSAARATTMRCFRFCFVGGTWPQALGFLRTAGACAVAILLILATGCVSPMIKTTRLNPGPDATETKTVTVYKQGGAAPSNYEVLGVVTAVAFGALSESSALKKLKAEAAAMGADALVGFYMGFVEGENVQLWASALAARVLPAGQNVASRKGDFFAAVPHTLLEKDVATGGRAVKLDDAARKFAQFHLSKKGYYAVLVEQPMPDPFEGSFQAMDDAGLGKYGGAEADLVLGVQFVAKSSGTVVLVSAVELTLETALYSKSQKKATWHGTGTGSAWTGMFINIGAPNTKRLMAIQAAMEKAFESLPDISTKTKP